MARICLILCFCGFCGSAYAEPKLSPADLAAIREQKTRAEQRALEIDSQLRDIRRIAAQSPDLAPLYAAIESARGARDAKLESAGIIAARKARDEASAAAEAVLMSELQATKPTEALLAYVKAADAELAQLQRQQMELREQRTKIRFEVRTSPGVLVADQGVRAASEAYRRMPQTDPKLAALWAKLAEAREAFESANRGEPQREALMAAHSAFEGAMAECAELAAAKKAVDAAYDAWQQALDEAIAANPDGARIGRELEQVRQKLTRTREALAKAQQQIAEVRTDAQLRNPKVIAATRLAQQAEDAYQRVQANETRAESQALHDARTAYDAAIAMKLRERGNVRELQQKLAALDDHIQALTRKIHQAEASAKP